VPCGSPSFPLPGAGLCSGEDEIGPAMTVHEEQERSHDGSLYVAISNAIVRLLREYTGRGPTKARTTIRDNVILVILEQALTKGERSLVGNGRAEKVLEIRHEYQEAMRADCIATVSELTGRNVTAMLSANHISPDIAAEVFILDGPPDHGFQVSDGMTDTERSAAGNQQQEPAFG
jgi:uncharacterized protein YbcI